MPTEAKIWMKPASLTGVLHVIEKTKCISFLKHNSLKDHQGSVLKVLSKTCGDIGEIMLKKHAVEKKSKKIVTVWKNFCPAFCFLRDKEYLF